MQFAHGEKYNNLILIKIKRNLKELIMIDKRNSSELCNTCLRPRKRQWLCTWRDVHDTIFAIKITFKYGWGEYFIKIAVHARHTCDSSAETSHVRILLVSRATTTIINHSLLLNIDVSPFRSSLTNIWFNPIACKVNIKTPKRRKNYNQMGVLSNVEKQIL